LSYASQRASGANYRPGPSPTASTSGTSPGQPGIILASPAGSPNLRFGLGGRSPCTCSTHEQPAECALLAFPRRPPIPSQSAPTRSARRSSS